MTIIGSFSVSNRGGRWFSPSYIPLSGNRVSQPETVSCDAGLAAYYEEKDRKGGVQDWCKWWPCIIRIFYMETQNCSKDFFSEFQTITFVGIYFKFRGCKMVQGIMKIDENDWTWWSKVDTGFFGGAESCYLKIWRMLCFWDKSKGLRSKSCIIQVMLDMNLRSPKKYWDKFPAAKQKHKPVKEWFCGWKQNRSLKGG